jgi:Predicted transcriptional regulators
MLNWTEIVDRLFLLYDVSTQTALSDRIGVKQTLISRWTKDPSRRPSWETLEKVVQDKGVTWDWLLEGREPKYRL